MQQNVTQFFYNTEDNLTCKVRTWKDVDNGIWFCAKDVCDILEISNSRDAVAKVLDDDEKMTVEIGDSHSGQRGGAQKLTFISESGLYTLIMRSNKPEAKRFRRWVTEQVLPQIRKTGSYTGETKEAEIVTTPAVRQKVKALSRKGVPQGIMKGAEKILERTGLNEVQMTLAMDKVFQEFAGVSVLEIAGIKLVAVERESLACDWGDHKNYSTFREWEWQHEYPSGKMEYLPEKSRTVWENELE